MQSFKFTCQQIETFTKKSKQFRQQDIRQIKKLYKQLQQKQEKPFENTVQRIKKNMCFYRQNNFKKCLENIDTKEIIQKCMNKIQEYDTQINRMNSILEKGCGKIVVRFQNDQKNKQKNNQNTDQKDDKQNEIKQIYEDNGNKNEEQIKSVNKQQSND